MLLNSILKTYQHKYILRIFNSRVNIHIIIILLLTTNFLSAQNSDGIEHSFQTLKLKERIVQVDVDTADIIATRRLFSELRLVNLGVDDGLSQGMVTDILQDYRGFMWFATHDGLNRYDGHRFTTYHYSSRDSNTIQHNEILKLHEDEARRLWVETKNGLSYYNRDKDRFIRLNFPNIPRELKTTPVATLFRDNIKKQYLIFSGETFYYLKLPEKHGDPASLEKTSLTNNYFKSLSLIKPVFDLSGALWLIENMRIYRLLEARSLFKSGKAVNIPAQIINSLYGPHTALADPGGRIWISFWNGIAKFDPISEELTRFALPASSRQAQYNFMNIFSPSGSIELNKKTTSLNDQSFIIAGWSRTDIAGKRTYHTFAFNMSSGKFTLLDQQHFRYGEISKIYQSRSGVQWIATPGWGLYKMDPQTSRFQYPEYFFQPTEKSSKQLSMRAMHLDPLRNELWVMSNLYHLYQIQRDKATIERMVKVKWKVQNFAGIRGDELWITSDKGLIRRDLNTGKFDHYDPSTQPGFSAINIGDAIFAGPEVLYFVGFHEGKSGIGKFDPLTGYQFYPYHAGYQYFPMLFEDNQGLLWFTGSDAVVCFDPRENAYLKKIGTNPEQDGLSHPNASSIIMDPVAPDRYFWISTLGGGLNRYDRQTGAIKIYTTEEGLPNNTVYGILADENGYLWMSTNYGLSRFNPINNTFRNYTAKDGLQSNEFNRPSFHKGTNGEMFFGGIYGFNSFFPASINENSYIPPITFTDILYYNPQDEQQVNGWVRTGESPTELSKLSLPYFANTISIEFAALDYNSTASNHFAYKLEGMNDEWIQHGKERRINFSGLGHGEYLLRVKGTNNDGVWNEVGATLAIIISPPWWRTWWAYAAYMLILLSILYVVRKSELNRQRLKHDLQLEHIQAEKLQEMDRLKSRFFANISHEFRTPLTLILGPINTLRKTYNKPEAVENLDIMQRNSQRLLHLINQLLDLSRLEAGKMDIAAQPQNIIPFLKGIVFSFESLARERNIELRVDDLRGQSDQPLVLNFDPEKMENVLINLLSNAFKFTPDGGAIIVELASDNQSATITVADSGRGIPAAALPRIFDRFHSVGDSYIKDQPGSGIGLAICKELIELHDGTITAESTVDEGSRFTITLPIVIDVASKTDKTESTHLQKDDPPETLSPTVSAEAAAPTSEKTSENINAPQILIVEDNDDMRAYIRRQLQADFRIAEAADGAAGFDEAAEVMPALIISDVMMPKMDGYQLCEKLKSDERTSHIPVILLTAKSSGDSKVEGLQLGADDYLIKPFNSRELLVRVKNLIEQRQKLRARFAKEIPLGPKDITVTSADEEFLQRAIAIIETNMENAHFTVEQFAAEMAFSRHHLNRKLKGLTDLSSQDFIRTIRLKRAGSLLKQQFGTVSEIAYTVGFSSPSYFTRCFREQFGMLPSEYAADSENPPR